MVDRVGEQFGNYRLVQLLGQGGFADVYLAEHIHLEIQAAVKVLSIRLTSDSVEQFRTEARTVARLIHPHIVRVLDFGVEGTTPYLAMDYAPHGTLRHRHPKGTRLPLTSIVSYVKQVAEALQYAHEKKLIHRDIKPENMLLGENSQILLSDFGIALVAQSTRYQNTQEVIGTAAYMAPEQLQGKPRRSSDQYSLGIVVYEWICGDRPFHGSFTEIYSQQMFVPPPPLRVKMPELPPAVDQVVQTALAKDPQQRFANIQAFARALEQSCQPEQPITIIPPSVPLRPTQPVSAPLPPTQLVATPLPPTQPIITPPLPPTQFIATPPPPSTQPVVTSLTPKILGTYRDHSDAITALAWSPDGKYIASGSHDRTVHIWNSTTGKRLITYRGYAQEIGSVVWSPDSTRLAFSPGDIVQIWDTAKDKCLVTYNGHASSISALAWSLGGKQLASGSRDRTVHIWNSTTGKRLITYSGYPHPISAMAWSPVGTRLAFSPEDTVQIWDTSTDKRLVTYRRYAHPISALVWSPDGKRLAFSPGNRVQVWDTATDKCLVTYTAHSGTITALAWSPDGKYIASGGRDQTVHIWDASNGKQFRTYQSSPKGMSNLVWSPDGTYIAFSFENLIQVWQAS